MSESLIQQCRERFVYGVCREFESEYQRGSLEEDLGKSQIFGKRGVQRLRLQCSKGRIIVDLAPSLRIPRCHEQY